MTTFVASIEADGALHDRMEDVLDSLPNGGALSGGEGFPTATLSCEIDAADALGALMVVLDLLRQTGVARSDVAKVEAYRAE